MKSIKRALISVSDKTNIVEIARFLSEQNIDILSTGGTAKLLKSSGINIMEVDDYTQFPELMDGRLKTLHPKIHGGILGRRDQDEITMQQYNISTIDLVIVNLYPFQETIAKNSANFEEAIENIDIGGPTMLRAAAKNHNDVCVICDPNDYLWFINELKQNDLNTDLKTRIDLARKAFHYTAHYDEVIASYFDKINMQHESSEKLFADKINIQYHKKQEMRYGENPHQRSALYVDNFYQGASVVHAKQLQGKALSYNNIADTDAALECVNAFHKPACVIVKHANPCGVAQSENITQAYKKAFSCDPSSAFGGIIAFNRALDKQTAELIINNQFVEVIIAPSINNDALCLMATKKKHSTPNN